MEFAVVKIAGKQHLVKVGDTINVAADLGEAGKNLTLSEVLLVSRDDQLSVGTPLVDGVVVKAEIESSGKGEKIRVAKFKAKSRYRRVIGFRPNLTKLKISAINLGKTSDTIVEKPTGKVTKKSK